MPKRKSKKEKDFQKVKFKVGKKLPKAENVTSTAFKSRAIVIKEQLKETSANELRQEIFRKSRDPQELLAHLQHYNLSFRFNSLNTIKAIMTSDPNKLSLHMGAVLDRVAALSSDVERDIRNAALECLKSIFSCLTAKSVVAFIPTVIAHLRCAMTHLTETIQLDSLQLLELLVSHYPQAITQELFKLTQNFLDLISTRTEKSKRSLKVSPVSKLATARWRQQVFSLLEKLLSVQITAETTASPNTSTHSTTIDLGVFETSDLPAKVYCLVDESMYLSTRGLEQVTLRRHDIGSVTEDSNSTLLENFIRELMPLLGETWVELVSSEGGVGAEARPVLLSITNIISRLCHMVNSSEIKDPQPIIAVMRNGVQSFLEQRFPIACDDRKFQKDKRKSVTAQSAAHVTSALLNIKLCSLAGILGCADQKTRNYMLKFLQSSDFSQLHDHLDVLLYNLEAGEMLEKVVIHLVYNQHLTESKLVTITRAINTLIGGESISPAIENAMVTLACAPDISPSSLVGLLALINRACLTQKMTLGAKQMIVLIKGCIDLQRRVAVTSSNEDQQALLRTAISLVDHVDEITVDTLRVLKELCLLNVTCHGLVNLLLHVLYNKTQNGSLARDLHISFLLSLLNTDIVEVNIARSVLQHITYVTPNTEQVVAIMEHHYRNVMEMEGSLSLHLCSMLLLSQIVQHFSPDFISEMVLSYLSHICNMAETSNCPSVDVQTNPQKVQCVLSAVTKSKLNVPHLVWSKLAKQLEHRSCDKALNAKVVEWMMYMKWHKYMPEGVESAMADALGVHSLEDLLLPKVTTEH